MSITRIRTARLPMLAMLATLLALAFTTAAWAQLDKQAMHDEMASLLGSKSAVDQARLRELSDALGGDLPAAASAAVRSPRGAVPAPPNCAATLTAATDAVVTPIPDDPTVVRTVTIAGANPFTFRVSLLTDIDHTFPGDLDITLTSPAGTTIVISTDNASTNDNVFAGTLWSDFEAAPVTDFVFATNVVAPSLIPEAAFGAFYGENPNGIWTLTIDDDAAGDVGSLNSWSVDVVALAAAPIAATTSIANNTVTPIPDGPGGNVLSTVAPAGLGTFLCRARLTTDIPHAFSGDLDITLQAPGGVTQTVTTDNGGGNDNVFAGTLWDDDAPIAATNFVYANLVVATPLVVEGALSGFAGVDPNGTWTLSITDDASLDIGTLESWTLETTTCTCALPDADLALTKSVSAGVVPVGSNAVFTLTVTNNGPAAATNVVVTDTLPAGLTYVSNDCGALFASPTLTWNVGALAAAASAVCNLTVAVGPGVSVNTAVATADQSDPSQSDNTAFATVTGDQSVLEIPTLDEAGLLALIAGLLGAALWVLRRRG